MANANVKTNNPDRLLVAVDIVSYFMKKENPDLTTIFQDTSIGNTAESYRRNAGIPDGVNFKDLLEFADKPQECSVHCDFEEIVKNGLTSTDSLYDYAQAWKSTYLDVDISIRSFSLYCTRIAAMARMFYDTGMMDAPDFAVDLIVSSFPDDPNLNWTYLDFADELNKIYTEEISKTFQNYTRREPAGIISSETEESSNDSIRICESDSSSNDKFLQSEGYFGKQNKSSVTPSEKKPIVESLTVKISELRVSNLDTTSAVIEQKAGGCIGLAPVPITRSSSVSPRKRSFPKDESSQPPTKCFLGEFTISAVAEQTGGCSSLTPVPVTRSSSVSPRKTASARDESSPSPSKSHTGQLTKPSMGLGKRRSICSDDIVSSNIAESAADKDSTAEEVFLPRDPKKSKVQEVDKSE